MAYTYPLKFEINSNWAILAIDTPGITLEIESGEDLKTHLYSKGRTLLLWGRGSLALDTKTFFLRLKSAEPLTGLVGSTEHGTDAETAGDGKGQVTLSTLNNEFVNQHKEGSDIPGDFERFRVKIKEAPVPLFL